MADFKRLVPVATDNFNRADANDLGANWTDSVPAGDIGITSNQAAQKANTNDNVAFYSGATFSKNQYAQAVMSETDTASSGMGLVVRASATDYVMAQQVQSSTDMAMYWYNAGAYTQIGSTYTAADFVDGDVVRLEAVGQTFTLYVNGVAKITGTNTSAPSTGAPGILLDEDGDRIDDFEGGNIVAHEFVSNQAWSNASNPSTQSINCAAGTTLLVLNIVTGSGTARAGGAPTFNGVTMTQAGSTQKAAASPETNVEQFYLLAPATGSSYSISVPNTNTATLHCQASWFSLPSGYKSVFDVAGGNNGTSANPSVSVTTRMDGDAVVAALGDGLITAPTAQTLINLNRTDNGAYSDSSQYLIQAEKGSIACGWTVASDDWGLVVGAYGIVADSGTVRNFSSNKITNASSSTHAHFVEAGLTNPGLLVLVGTYDFTTPADAEVTGVTHNGNAMTELIGVFSDPGNDSDEFLAAYYIANPTSGWNNIIASFTGSVPDGNVHAITLSGVDSTQADATIDDGTGSATSFPISITTVANNCYVFSLCAGRNTEGFIPTTTAQTLIAATSSAFFTSSYTGPKTPAGSVTHTYDNNRTDEAHLIAVSIKPYGGTSVTVSAGEIGMTSSVQSPSVTTIRNELILPGVISLSSSVQSPTVKLGMTIAADVVSSTFSIEDAVATGEINLAFTPDVVLGSFSVVQPRVVIYPTYWESSADSQSAWLKQNDGQNGFTQVGDRETSWASS